MNSNVRPGIHPKFNLSRFNDEEQLIIKNLSKSWYLTSSGEEINIGKSKYNYFLLKPLSKFSEMFNIEREIICIFSKYSNFEPRTLDTFDCIHRDLPKLRAENICCILISKDNNIDNKIDTLLKTEAEYPIIIPFTYKDLFIENEEITYENKFRQKFYSRDLFSFLSPLKKDTYFFGRNHLVNEIINRHKSSEHSSLFGLRKSGKTSIVYALQRRLKLDQIDYLSIDCESPSIHIKRWNQLIENIVRQFHTLKKSHVRINYENRYLEHNAADNFETDILKIFKSSNKIPTVFIFDEIERISPDIGSSENWSKEKDFIYFWQTLRAFYQKHPDIFTYMLVGTNPSCIENPIIFKQDNPLYGSIHTQYVPSFTLEQVKEMVQKLSFLMGLEIDDYICSKLFDDFGGHPFLIRQMCSLLNKKVTNIRPSKIDKALYKSTIQEFKTSSHEYLDMMIYVLKEWYPDEYEMLTYLANDDTEIFEDFAADHINYTRHLIGYELIQKGQDGYCFNFEILQKHIQNINKYKKLNLSQEDKLSEISKRRNKIEKGLRVLVKNSLRSSVGNQKAIEKVTRSIQQDRREKLSTYTLNELLSKDNSPLFFLELINIIKKNWAELSNTFEIEKNKLTLILEDINDTGRPDAHAKYINSHNFTQLRLHFDTIENILKEWDLL